MKKNFIVLLVAIVLLSSCSSLFNPKYQKVEVLLPPDTELYINGEQPKMKGEKYKIERSMSFTQVELRREGFKSEYSIICASKINWITYPLNILWIIPASWSPGWLAAPPIFALFDNGKKSRNYEKQMDLRVPMIERPGKNETSKFIRIGRISVDVLPEDIKAGLCKWKKFKNNSCDELDADTDKNSESLKLSNTIFTDMLNEILVDNGFIDTTNLLFKDSYLKNLYVESVITGIRGHTLYNRQNYAYSIEIDVKWTVKDFYKSEIFEYVTTAKSGYLRQSLYVGSSKDKTVECFRDAMEISFFDLLSSPQMQKELRSYEQQEIENNYPVLTLPKSDKYVTNVNHAAQASVTIKVDKSHGSGFFITSDGYIVTNYHVIAKTGALTVVDNSGNEYTPEIIRVSKLYDLALLKVDAKGIVPYKIDNSTEIMLASDIYVIGTPSSDQLGQTISRGIISSTRKTETYSQLIQTDASINSGNSGGAIIDDKGNVIGVATFKFFGIGVEGISFGIPAYEIYDRLKIEFN